MYVQRGEIKEMIEGKSPVDAWLKLIERIYLDGYEAITPKSEGVGRELRNVLVKVPPSGQRTHRLYGGLSKTEGSGLQLYIDQVVGESSHNTTFRYTYHQRLKHYGMKNPWEIGGYDQIDALVSMILPFKRSYMAQTWYVPDDNIADISGGDQPCMLVLWCWLGWETIRFPSESQKIAKFYYDSSRSKLEYNRTLLTLHSMLREFTTNNKEFHLVLDMHCIWRNRDAASAWLDNVNAFQELQRSIAVMMSKDIGVPVKPRFYYDFNIAIQIYPRDFQLVKEATGIRTVV